MTALTNRATWKVCSVLQNYLSAIATLTFLGQPVNVEAVLNVKEKIIKFWEAWKPLPMGVLTAETMTTSDIFYDRNSGMFKLTKGGSILPLDFDQPETLDIYGTQLSKK